MTSFVAKAMKPSAPADDHFGLVALSSAPDCGARMLELLPGIGDADSTESAERLFRHALRLIGADAGAFLTVIRDNAVRSSYRSLYAGAPLWATEYARCGWHDHDPWLRHAVRETEPIRSRELTPVSAAEEAFVATAAKVGFASAVIVPAPTCAGLSRLGVLCVGSRQRDFFDADEHFAKMRILARALAMELHRWMHRSLREELVRKSRLTAADIVLLHHEEQGHTSKVIAVALNTKPQTIDCRFQRICAKLDAPDRRSALRIAKLYGLI